MENEHQVGGRARFSLLNEGVISHINKVKIHDWLAHSKSKLYLCRGYLERAIVWMSWLGSCINAIILCFIIIIKSPAIVLLWCGRKFVFGVYFYATL